MSIPIKEIAELFSTGKFEQLIDFLSDEVIWNVIGEKTLTGKKEVVAYCKMTTEYFKSLETDFKIEDTIVSNNKVIVMGTGEFKRSGEIINFISACDSYIFDKMNKIETISSYCIPEKGRIKF